MFSVLGSPRAWRKCGWVCFALPEPLGDRAKLTLPVIHTFCLSSGLCFRGCLCNCYRRKRGIECAEYCLQDGTNPAGQLSCMLAHSVLAAISLSSVAISFHTRGNSDCIHFQIAQVLSGSSIRGEIQICMISAPRLYGLMLKNVIGVS